MNTQSANIDLITKYFSGETSPEEIQHLLQWLKTDPLNQELFDEYNKTWQLFEKNNIDNSINVEEEWSKFKISISPVQPQTEIYKLNKEQHGKKTWLVRMLQIAAVIIFVALGSFFIYRYLNQVEQKVLTASTETIETSLPDGTIVTLNTGSSIVYPSKFNEEKRIIKLEGEAYFDVKRNESQPFLITTGNICIEVLGTSFYVNTNNSAGNVEVVLTSGKVAIYYLDKPENKIILAPGERTELPKEGQDIDKSVNQDENYMAWKTKKIVFTDEPLKIVIPILNKVYHSDIKLITNSIADCRITATFDKQSLEAILNVLEATLDLNITKKGSTIEVSGKGCK